MIDNKGDDDFDMHEMPFKGLSGNEALLDKQGRDRAVSDSLVDPNNHQLHKQR